MNRRRYGLFALLIALGAIGCQTASTELLEDATMPRDPTTIRPNLDVVMNSAAGTVYGHSVRGVPIVYRAFPSATPGAKNVLIFAGIHGNETGPIFAAQELLKLLDASRPAFDVNLYVIAIANPDGYAKKQRVNVRQVDLNRNFPATNFKTASKGRNGPTPLSEPESKALHDLVLTLQPIRILTMHSIQDGRKYGVNYDGPARELAELMARHNGYPVVPTMGYDTPGSFGSWVGIDRQTPVITLESPARDPGAKVWKDNRDALFAFIAGR